MTIQEASERYHIPMPILREYERWGLCSAVKSVMGDWQYDDADLERLSTIMTLHDIGFTVAEVEAYMRLLLEGEHTAAQRLDMLEKQRSAALEESTSRSVSSSGWITCVTRSERRKKAGTDETDLCHAGPFDAALRSECISKCSGSG